MVGELGHAEVEGTLGNAPSTTVISKVEDLEGVKLKRKVGVIVQTTQSRQNFQSVILKLLTKTEELRIFNTICDATTQRQHTCALLAQRSDVMIVIGGKIRPTRLGSRRSRPSCAPTRIISKPRRSFNSSGLSRQNMLALPLAHQHQLIKSWRFIKLSRRSAKPCNAAASRVVAGILETIL